MAGKEKDSAEKSREFEGLILDLKKEDWASLQMS